MFLKTKHVVVTLTLSSNWVQRCFIFIVVDAAARKFDDVIDK